MQDSPIHSPPRPEPPWFLRLDPRDPSAESKEVPQGSPALPAGDRPREPNTLPPNALGLALSGGGLRSAAFSLGVLQALARGGWLRWVDYLSTVSGGGYTGAFVGRWFDLWDRPDEGSGVIVPNRAPGAAQNHIASSLTDFRSAPLDWLRRNASYLSPTGLGQLLTNVAGFWRNLLSVYLVGGIFLFALFGVLNALGYSDPRGPVVSLLKDFIAILSPLSTYLPAAWAGPWTVLAELILWLAVLPLMAAYWLVSQDLPEAFIAPALIAAALLAISLVLATFNPLSIAVLAAAVFWALEAWRAVRRIEGHADPFNRFRLLLARNHLTRRLAFWLAALAALAALAVVDGIGSWLARRMLEGGLTLGNVARWLSSLGLTVLALAWLLRMAARLLIARPIKDADGALASRRYFSGALVLVCAVLPPLVFLSFASHAAYEAGEDYRQGLWFTAAALVFSLLLGSRACVPFINRSGPLAIFAARLARTFLGAVNPQRRLHPEGKNITYLVPGDDVPFHRYHPEDAGGPLHLINCAVNESVDGASQRGQRSRAAENFAIGPAGVSVAQRWHALWTEGATRLPALAPLAQDGGPHPFLSRQGDPVEVESLDLREWLAISGTTLGPGLGGPGGLGRTLLLTLADLRLGYWWNSGLARRERPNVPVKGGLWRSVLESIAWWFRAQTLLFSEARGRFGGPWNRYWHLSDGGDFESTGAYELLRRRVPFVIVCDAEEDPHHRGSALARLIRQARVDLGAEFEEVGADPNLLQPLGIPPQAVEHLGVLSDVAPSDGKPARKHAALLRVHYPGGPGAAWSGRDHTWLLYLKSVYTGDESADLRNYKALHRSFPDESTFDQLFDEPQWESYRELGEHIGASLFI